MVLRWFIGPWPYFPWVMFPLLTSYLILQNLQLAIVSPTPVCHWSCVRVPAGFVPALDSQYAGALAGQVDLLLIVVNAAAASAAVAGLAWLLQRWLVGNASGTPRHMPYLVGLLAIAVTGTVFRVYVLNPLLDSQAPLAAIVPNSIRMFALLTLIEAVSGQLTQRYRRTADLAGEALIEVDRQRLLMLTADEEARREVAAFLHDRVQADLLVVGVELERSRGAHGDPSGDIGKAIGDIERIRSSDVRSAGRRLSPDFEAVGLDTALAELARSWKGVVQIDVRGAPGAMAPHAWRTLSTDVLMGCYRVVEQSLLNAVAHGRAERVSITFENDGRSVQLEILDDGNGMTSMSPVIGRGGSIIDAWVATLGGAWSWGTRSPGPGAWLRAEFPVRDRD